MTTVFTSTPENWSPDDDVVINNSSGVTVNGTAVAHSLTLDGFSELNLSGTLTLGTSLTLDGGELSPGANIQDTANNSLTTVAGDFGLQVHATSPSTMTATYGFMTLENPTMAAVLVPLALNNSGQVVGYNSSGDFLYSNGTYTTLAFPLAQNTWADGINNAGQIVGQYIIGSNVVFHGFFYSNGTYTALDDPSATSGSSPVAINSSGQVLGEFTNSSGNHGFLYSNGTYSTLDDPLSTGGSINALGGHDGGTLPSAINDIGQIVGSFTDSTGTHGFLYNNGTYITLDDPSATLGTTRAIAINDIGQVIGDYNDASGIHGFLYSNGTYTTLDDPAARPGTTEVQAINNIGQIVGSFTDANGNLAGFLYSGGNYTTIENPLGTSGTNLTGINDLGQIVGYYIDSSGSIHGFVASQPAPQATTIQQEIAGLYAAVYDRAADSLGMQYWVNVVAQQADALGITYSAAANTPISTADAALLGQLFVSTQSAYFNQTYGNLNDSDFVNALYFNIGGQDAESSSAIAYWVNIIQTDEASGLSVQNARAAVVGQFVHDLIDVNLAQWTTILTPSELETTILRQAVVDNKLAVSLAYVNASAGLGGSVLNAHAVGDAGFQAEVRALGGVAIDPSTATVQITGINNAVANQNLADIQPVS